MSQVGRTEVVHPASTVRVGEEDDADDCMQQGIEAMLVEIASGDEGVHPEVASRDDSVQL